MRRSRVLESGGRCGLRCAVTPPLASHRSALQYAAVSARHWLHEEVTKRLSPMPLVTQRLSCELRTRKTRTEAWASREKKWQQPPPSELQGRIQEGDRSSSLQLVETQHSTWEHDTSGRTMMLCSDVPGFRLAYVEAICVADEQPRPALFNNTYRP
jgi:hypothetical protein